MQDAHDLGLVIDAHVSLIVLESYDENQAVQLLQRVARKRELPLTAWTVTEGLKMAGFGLQIERNSEHQEPEDVLTFLKTKAQPGLFVLCDFHPYLIDQPKNVRLLKDFALRNMHERSAIILLSHRLSLPPELTRLSARFSMSLPSDDQIMALVREEAKTWARRNQGQKVKTDSETLQQLVGNLKGLTQSEVRRLVRGAIVDDGAICEADLPEINRTKFQLMDMEGVLSYEYSTEKFSDVAGMNHLVNWLGKRQTAFLGEEIGFDRPKGILLTGVQGGGKSLAAKAVAGIWGVPLLRLDMATLYNKFYGETERNLRESLKLAEQMSPCILWVDEIEKSISVDSNDSGTSQRVLGTLLTWMAEQKKSVFIVATSNDISKLPPELIRKGRLDELFFVDLPDSKIRQDIFKIHLQKRNLNPDDFNLEELSVASEGFTGAEIEQAVVSALYSASDGITTIEIINELLNTSPLSQIMDSKISKLRSWAKEKGLVSV